MSSRRLEIVEEIWRRFEADGVAAATAALWEHATEDVELAPLFPGGGAVRGRAALRALVEEQARGGVDMTGRAFSVDEEGETVTVACSLRMREGEAHLSESQATLVYRFDGDRIRAVGRMAPAP